MDRMDYFIELYGSLPRGGPGDNSSTRRAFAMLEHVPPEPRILDLGCGPGMQTVELLRLSGGTAVALDLLPQMIARVREAAEAGRLSGSVYDGDWADVGTPERLAALNL